MAGLQMPKKGQGLQSLRDLKDREREEDREPAPPSEVTDFRNNGLTEGLTERRKDGMTDERTDGRPPVSQDGQTAVSPSVSEGGQPHGEPASAEAALGAVGGQPATPPALTRRAPRPPAPEPDPEPITDENFADVVRQAIAAKRTLAGGNKTTVDMTPELAKRAALYSLDHAKVSTRQMFVELLEAFLTLEGY